MEFKQEKFTTEESKQRDEYKIYAYAEPDNSYTIKLPEIVSDCKYKLRIIDKNTIKIVIVKKIFKRK